MVAMLLEKHRKNIEENIITKIHNAFASSSNWKNEKKTQYQYSKLFETKKHFSSKQRESVVGAPQQPSCKIEVEGVEPIIQVVKSKSIPSLQYVSELKHFEMFQEVSGGLGLNCFRFRF
eukprot:c1010_g1_i2 orf=51-407(+)